MLGSTWMFVVRTTAVVGVIAGGLGVLGVTAAKRTPAQEVEQWMVDNGGRKPGTFEELVARPANLRREFFRLADERQKAAMWRAQLLSFVEPVTELTSAQLELRQSLASELNAVQKERIVVAVRVLDSLFDSSVSDELRRTKTKTLCQENSSYFSKDQMIRIFGNLGRVVLPEPSDDSNTSDLMEAFREGGGAVLSGLDRLGLVRADIATIPACTCSRGNYCSCDNCGGSGCWINSGDAGYCGCLWVFPCDGYCDSRDS